MDQEFTPKPDLPVLVIGSSGLDMIGRLKSAMSLGTSNPAQIRPAFGGVARNISENLARLGLDVTLVSAVGRDHFGDWMMNEAEAVGVKVDYVIRSDQHPTGTYLGVLDECGELELGLDDMRVISAITPEYIRHIGHLFQESSVVYIDANLTKETIRTVISLARKARIPVCADPTSFSLAAKLIPYIKQIRMITPNFREAVILGNREQKPSQRVDALQAAKDLVAAGVSIVSVVMPDLDVVYATADVSGQISAIRSAVVDPTGAGDAFSAAVLFGLLSEMPVDEAVRLGASALSLTMTQFGSVVPDLSLQKLYDHLVA